MENKDINKALIRFTKAGKVHAEEKVNVVYLPLAEKLIFWTAQKGTDKIWPNGSLTDKDINNSPELQDIFVRLSKAERSEIVREVKFVWQNHDAIQDYVAENGWASIGYIRKQIAKAEKSQKADAETKAETEAETEAEAPAAKVKDIQYFADKQMALIKEAREAGVEWKDVIAHCTKMANAA